MNEKPNIMNNVIVAVIIDDTFTWYLCDKELWYMDYIKLHKIWSEFGVNFKLSEITPLRRHCLILDKSNAKNFLYTISQFKIKTEILRSLLISAIDTYKNNNWKSDYMPSFYVNFDESIFISAYSEPGSFENFTPNSWSSKFGLFLDDIPECYKFWKMENLDFLMTNKKENYE